MLFAKKNIKCLHYSILCYILALSSSHTHGPIQLAVNTSSGQQQKCQAGEAAAQQMHT